MKYLTGHEKMIQSLKTQVERLKDARERVKRKVDDAKRNGEVIEPEVDEWLTKVNIKMAEVAEKVMQDDEEKAKNKCFVGLCHNLLARYKHSAETEEDKDVAELLELGKFDRVSYRGRPQGITAAAVEGFETFESRMLVLKGIMEALKDDTVRVIGVHGMAGVGKTMLVREVARLVREDKLFDHVVMATVTQTLDVKNIQNQIADLLGFKFEEQSIVGRAVRLREILKEGNNLVVLDDIWQELDLEEVGIPSGDDRQRCKILLTSRDRNVLSGGMDAQKDFTVGLLNEEEAWYLFKAMAGGCVESWHFQPTAMEVAKKCAGLPLAIVAVARSLRKKSLPEWRNALRELKRPSLTNFKGIAPVVYSAVELSYSHLESEEIKLTFLLCSLIGHNGLVEDLLRYILGMGLFHGINAIEEARNRVLNLLRKLKASCLLLDSYDDEWFCFHDLVWDVAISIASRDHHMFVLRNGDELKEWPHKEIMKNCSAISLLSPRIMGELPDELGCPNLSFFLMVSDGSVQIPANFFRGTERLKVLSLTGMHFQSLPASICLLTELRTLHLKRCELEDITIVGELKNLEILNLAESDIKALPQEIRRLTRLRILDLNNCTELKIIPPGVLSSLFKLEELYMENSFVGWEDGAVADRSRNGSLRELKHLSFLTVLYVWIPDAQIIPENLFTQKLDRYGILVGNRRDWFGKYEYSRALKLDLYTTAFNFMKHHGVKIFLKKTEELHLGGLRGMRNVLGELSDGEDFPFPHLKGLHVRRCSDVQYIATENDKFARLRSLTLDDLPRLISFCSKENRGSSSDTEEVARRFRRFKPLPLFDKQLVFPHLTSLVIQNCNSLHHVLSPSISRTIVNRLTYFEIAGCDGLTEIISREETEEERIVICFPQLTSLKIRNLPRLVKFCSGQCNIEFPSLEVLEIEGCPTLQEFISEPHADEKGQHGMPAFFNDKVAFPNLEKMTISALRKMKMIWHNKPSVNSFSKLKEMTVRECDELITIFPSNMLGAFRELHVLRVSQCMSLKEVFELRGSDMEEIKPILAFELRELWICLLEQLEHIWSEDCGGIYTFQNLRVLNVRDCGSLKNVFPASVARVLPQLEDLSIKNCGVKEIVSMDQGLKTIITLEFNQVSSLTLWHLPFLRCFYPGEHITTWRMLKSLSVRGCYRLKIFSTKRLNMSDTNDDSQVIKSPIQAPLFWLEKGIPEFEELSLKVDDVAVMCDTDTQVLRSLFLKLKVLRVHYSYGEDIFLPISVLEQFCNLEKLEVRCCDFKYLFSYKREEMHAGSCLQIRTLELDQLPYLRFIWEHDSVDFVGHILPYLENLEVTQCNWLISLGLSPVSFTKLTRLVVRNCRDLKNLVPSSAVKSLLHLEQVKVDECHSMKEIIGSEEDEETSEIVFTKLKCLELQNLPKLKSFSSSKHRVVFPSLEEVIVQECPMLEIFSHGVHAPMLRRVRLTSLGSKGCWAGDLNSTIQQLYTKEALHNPYPSTSSDARVAMETVEVIPSANDNNPVMDEPKAAIVSHTEAAPQIQETGGAATIEHNLSKIMEFMDTDTVTRIALHGVCGVGKTSVLRALASNPKTKRKFDLVIWVTVTKYWSSKKIQYQILHPSPPPFSDADPFLELKDKKVLLLLDDVWERIDLQKMGIPCPSLEKGSMMILATRELKVCHEKDMEEIEIKPVSPPEAWELFLQQVPWVCDSPNIIQYFARGIVQKCCGLPLFIIVTGRALADEKDVLVWEHAFNEFSLPGRNIISCIEDQIQLLRFSFDRLNSPSLKSCFLYCALYSEDEEINTVKFVDDCIQERLIAGTWTHSYKRGHDVVDALLHALLLETTEDGQSIRMRDVMRELAFRILSSDTDGCQFLLMNYPKPLKPENRPSSSSFTADAHQFLSRLAGRLAEPLTEEEWKQSRMIFLMDKKLSALPDEPNCPDLLGLFLQRNHQMRVVPDHFFDRMPSLKVLNLSKTRIKFLPKSISNLVNLEFLLFRDCERLVKLPSEVGSLQLLQVLDLGGSEIMELAEEVGALASLRHLEVSFYGSSTSTEHLKLPRRLISRLQALETLRINVYPEDSWWNKNVESFIDEVSNLRQLAFLSFYFPEVKHLDLFLQRSVAWNEKSLREFKFVVGHDVKFNSSRIPKYVELNYDIVSGRCLRFVNSEETPGAILTLLASCTALHLDHHLCIRRLSEFRIGNINQLKYCIISECPHLETVVDCRDGTEIEFTSLEHLSIHYSWSLTCIWGVVRNGSFAALKTLSVHACPKLAYVFKSSMLQFLSNLEELQVDDCKEIEEIVSTTEVQQSGCILLKSLRLHYLPKLVRIWEGAETKLLFEYITIYDCPKLDLKQIFEDSELKNTLKEIRAEEDWWKESQLSSHFEANIFTPLREGDVHSS